MVDVTKILQQIDSQIAQLQQARALLKAGTGKAKSASRIATKRKKKRNLTPEGRKRIAEAVKRRWERQRKAASGKR